jgi:NADH-quinone oxidoreductase subunit G
MPKITVDGKSIEAKDRQMILQACLDAGISLPHYCYHPGLSIPASCRICLVEVEGLPKLVPSCQTPVRDGMVVHSTSPKAVANQKQVMEYLLINHPLDCPVCDQAGECLLQDYSYEYGRSQSRFEEDKHKKPKKDVGLNVLLYNDRCIMCTRCVRFTREV